MPFENVEPAQGEHCIMHGKVIVADRATALIGSANFIFSGLNSNYEFGVRVPGPVAADVVSLVERLHKQGWLQRISIP